MYDKLILYMADIDRYRWWRHQLELSIVGRRDLSIFALESES